MQEILQISAIGAITSLTADFITYPFYTISTISQLKDIFYSKINLIQLFKGSKYVWFNSISYVIYFSCYQKLNSIWSKNSYLKESCLFYVSPFINIILAQVPANFCFFPIQAIINRRQVGIKSSLKDILNQKILNLVKLFFLSYTNWTFYLAFNFQFFEVFQNIIKTDSITSKYIIATIMATTLGTLIIHPFNTYRLHVNMSYAEKKQTKIKLSLIKLYKGILQKIIFYNIYSLIYMPIYGIYREKTELNYFKL